MATKLNLEDLAEAGTQDGKDPEIHKNATQYSTRDYQMTVEPLLEELATNPALATLIEDTLVGEVTIEAVQAIFDTDAFHAIVQKTLLNQKYEVLEKSSDNKEEAKEQGLLIPRRRKITLAA